MNMTSKEKILLNNVDIKNLIDLSWNQLGILLTGLTAKESNKVIKVLLKELEVLQSKLSEKHKEDNSTHIGLNKTLKEVDITEDIGQDWLNDYQDKIIGTDSEENCFEVGLGI